MRSTRRQRGVGLIEVLIALIVISFGLLGMAGLQLTGMKQSTNGFNRAKAVMLAENMATRMRINRAGVTDGLYSGFNSTAQVCTATPDPYCQARDGKKAQSCNVEELAAFDKFSVVCGDMGKDEASGGIVDLLPAGSKLTVTCVDTPCEAESSYTLSVEWLEGKNASTGDDQITSRVQMRLRP